MNRYDENFEKRFWNNVDIKSKDECWNWKLSICGSGYGQVRVSKPTRSKVNTHRVAYELFFEHIPQGAHVLHRCNNRRCVNPNHLYLGTQSNNTDDYMKESGWHNKYNTKFNEKDVSLMKRFKLAGFTYNLIGELFGQYGIGVAKLINERR